MPSLALTARAPCAQVNLDGFALPVKKLKGTDPVETLDFSRKNLGVASAVVIASVIMALITIVIKIPEGLIGMKTSAGEQRSGGYHPRNEAAVVQNRA